MRQFLAIELPHAVRSRLADLQSGLRTDLAGWRWTRSDAIHLTLRFLGEVDPELDRRARQSWRDCAARTRAFSFRLQGLGCFPGPRRPRVLWVGIEADAIHQARLEGLAAGLEIAARDLGFEGSNRTFRPHLTLGRAARGIRPVPPGPSDFDGGRIDAAALVLFRSELHRAGARYTAMDTFPFGTNPGECF